MANGYVRYGNSIHLDGFQILDFCIENAISLESLSDRNLGRKVFLTGNDTNQGYLRENVWDGDRWRATAYLDDIDKITNGEGSLGTRVKALEDMLNVDSAETVVSTWEEIQAFLDNVKEGTDLMTMLDDKLSKSEGGTITGQLTSNERIILKSFLQFKQFNADAEYLLGMTDNNGILRWYNGSSWNTLLHSGNALDLLKETFLPLTGGTISSGSDIPLILKTTSSTTMWLKFVLRDGEVAHIGVSKHYRLLFDANGAQNDILHSGNVGDYALKNYKNQGAVDYNDVFYNGIQYVSGQSNNTPIKYGILMSTSIGDASWQLIGGRINEGLYFRGGGKDNTTWGDWKQIAFMDSNVASAASLSDFYGKRIDSANIETFGDGKVRKIIVTSTTTEGRPPHDGSILHFSWDNNSGHEHQLHIANSSTATANQRMSWRAQVNGTWGEWKSVAFTDSTVEAANRLANKVSLWGNEFDGTQSLDGGIAIKNRSGLYFANTSGDYVLAAYINSANKLIFGNGTTSKNISTYIHGNNIYFNVGSSAQTAMTITKEGNVLVGRQTNNLDAIIETRGLVHIEGGSTNTALGSAPVHGLTIGYDTIGGLAQWIHETNFSGNIQAMNLAGTATAYALNLNPLGGAVNVGSGGLNVAGIAAVATTLTVGASDGTSAATIYLQRASNNYIWANKTGGSIHLGVVDSGNVSNANASLSIDSDQIHPGLRDNAVSLGTSSYRWSNVYSVGGNFSGRVLIGGAVDDADYALNVKGDSYFGGTVYIPTGQKLTIGSVTFEEDAAGRVKVDGDLYTTGTLASGGKAKEGTGTGSGSANVRDFELPADGKTKYDCDHLLKSKNVIVQVFEKTIQNYIEVWEMIVADVTIVTEDRVTVTFGRPHNKVHRVHIIGGNVS